MSVLYLHFENQERTSRVQQLARSGAHVVVAEPRWPGFFELAKKEKPYAIAIDFSQAPSHALETADYLAKAKETREAKIFLLRVPKDRLDFVRKRLPQAPIVSDAELAERVEQAEREAQARAREKKQAAAAARKAAKARKAEAGGAISLPKPKAKAPPKAPAKKKRAAPAKKGKPKRAGAAKKTAKKKKSAAKKKSFRYSKKK